MGDQTDSYVDGIEEDIGGVEYMDSVADSSGSTDEVVVACPIARAFVKRNLARSVTKVAGAWAREDSDKQDKPGVDKDLDQDKVGRMDSNKTLRGTLRAIRRASTTLDRERGLRNQGFRPVYERRSAFEKGAYRNEKNNAIGASHD